MTLAWSDDVDVVSYYWGESNPSTTSVTWTNVGDSTSVNKSVTLDGLYYAAVKDISGKISFEPVRFYKTTFSVSNGSLSLPLVITMEGNGFPVPEVTLDAGYASSAWFYDSCDKEGAVSILPAVHIPTSSSIIYSCSTANTYTIEYRLANGDDTTANSSQIGTPIACKYGKACSLSSWSSLNASLDSRYDDADWIFAGWSKSQSCTSVDYADGYDFMFYYGAALG